MGNDGTLLESQLNIRKLMLVGGGMSDELFAVLSHTIETIANERRRLS